MRDAAGELADRIQLLRLRQFRLRALSFLGLGRKLRIDLTQLARPFRDTFLERGCKLLELRFGGDPCALALLQCARKRIEPAPEAAQLRSPRRQVGPEREL